MPMPLTRKTGPFNAINNTLDGYETNCTNHWRYIKTPLQSRRHYLKETLSSQSQSQWLEFKATYIKPSTLPSKGTDNIDTRNKDTILLFLAILFHSIILFWLWHRRRCGRHHIGDHPHSRSSLVYIDIQAGIWIHLGMHHSTDEVTLHH